MVSETLETITESMIARKKYLYSITTRLQWVIGKEIER